MINLEKQWKCNISDLCLCKYYDLANEAHTSYENLSSEARELYVVSDNDADIYRQRIIPVINNLKKKMQKGIYERTKAEKLAKYIMDDASKQYQKDFSNPLISHAFTPNERREAAAHWVINFESNLANDQY